MTRVTGRPAWQDQSFSAESRLQSGSPTDIQMQFVADPGFLVALAVRLGADIARGGQIGEHLIEVLRGLPFAPRRLGFWPFLVLARASALARRLSAIGLWHPPFSSFGSVLTGFSRASISVASRAITPTMRPPSERSISAACINFGLLAVASFGGSGRPLVEAGREDGSRFEGEPRVHIFRLNLALDQLKSS